ncbi:MAG: segregation/condensation protein A [Candidatus Omnitrophica bacterium]|nr:segregation/condensation protein A [Candidatus Omnitrophota bacterium]
MLELIKKNEIDIYNIPIAEITKQYLEHLARMKELNLEIAGEFIVMAATLIYIKSKMLLPQDGTEDDEEGGDPRAELVRRLLEYQAFKEVAKELGSLEDEQGKIFTRQITDYYLGELDGNEAEIDTFSANLYDLLTAFQSLLSRSGREVFHEVYEEIISIEEKMMEINSRLAESPRVVFSTLFSKPWSRNELIATFLAVLEIVRTKIARVTQDKHFGEIVLEKVVSA